ICVPENVTQLFHHGTMRLYFLLASIREICVEVSACLGVLCVSAFFTFFFLALERLASMFVLIRGFMTRNKFISTVLALSISIGSISIANAQGLLTDTLTTASGQAVLRATLTNGLQVIVVRNTLAPVVTTMINYK